MFSFRITPVVAGAAIFCASPLFAQALSGSNLTLSGTIDQNGAGTNDFDATLSLFDGRMCIGNGCDDATVGSPGQPPLKLRWSDPSLVFEDQTTTSSIPKRDWRIQINDNTVGGLDRFSIQDEGDTPGVETPVIPFTIVGGAPENAFWLAPSGDIGLGTSIPQAKVHLVDPGTETAIRMTKSGGSAHSWQLLANDAFEITDLTDARAALHIDTSGNVGFGTATPGAPLHVSSSDAFTFFRIEATGASPNTAADMTFTSGPAGSNGEYRINVVDGDGPEMRVDGNGYVTATAGFRVGATNLNVPDYVFEPGYELRPLAEVASFVEENGHLPEIPSAADVAASGLDMTHMQMALLKKVEELTLYTLAQEATIAAQETANAAQQIEITHLRDREARIIERLAKIEQQMDFTRP